MRSGAGGSGIGAILRAQWLSLRRGTPGGLSGALLTLIPAVLWYGFWSALAFAVHLIAREMEPRELIAKSLSGGLMLGLCYWQLAPVLSASLGASLDLRKLRVYPISDNRLFALEVLLRLASGVEVLLVLTGAGSGLARNVAAGGLSAAPRIALALAAFVALNLALGAGVRSLIERVLARKRVREAATFLIAMLAVLPQLLIATRAVSRQTLDRFLDFSSGGWSPWEVAARVAMDDRGGPAFVALLAWTVAAYLFGRQLFLFNLRLDLQPGATDAPSSREGLIDRFCRLPSLLLPDPEAAIVEKELLTLSRTPRFRLVFVMGFTFGLVVWLPTSLGGEGSSVMQRNLPVLVSVYALLMLGQVSYWNAFGFDRAAAQGWICWPVPARKIFMAKNFAAGVFVLLEMIAVMLVCIAAQREIRFVKLAEAFVVTPIVALYLFSAGNLSSVHFPRAMNPERMGQNPGRSQSLLLLLFPLMLFPVLLAYWGRRVFESDAVFAGLLAFAAVLGAVVYWIAMDSAVGTLDRQREVIVSELSRGSGPVARE